MVTSTCIQSPDVVLRNLRRFYVRFILVGFQEMRWFSKYLMDKLGGLRTYACRQMCLGNLRNVFFMKRRTKFEVRRWRGHWRSQSTVSYTEYAIQNFTFRTCADFAGGNKARNPEQSSPKWAEGCRTISFGIRQIMSQNGWLVSDTLRRLKY